MAKQEESIFKKGYTDFDKRLDQELEEEKIERRRQLMLQAPDFKLLNQMVENQEYSLELAAKLKDGGLYYLRSGEKDTVAVGASHLHTLDTVLSSPLPLAFFK